MDTNNTPATIWRLGAGDHPAGGQRHPAVVRAAVRASGAGGVAVRGVEEGGEDAE